VTPVQLRDRILRWARWWTDVFVWLVLAGALVAWGVMAWLVDWHWFGTLLAFGPRWVLLVPVAMMTVSAVFWRPRGVLPLLVAGAIVAGPVMGFCMPSPWTGEDNGEPTLKVLTCNTLGDHADSRLKTLIAIEQPDIVALQECPNTTALVEELEAEWFVKRHGDLLVASRQPIVASEPLIAENESWFTLGLRCEIVTPAGNVQFYCLHLPTPRSGLQAFVHRDRQAWRYTQETTLYREKQAEVVRQDMAHHSGPTIIAGDFNMTTESVIYRQVFGRFQNAFEAVGWGWGGTKFTRYHGVRIDHILADKNWQPVRCVVGRHVGSDHRPVMADWMFKRPSESTVAAAKQ